MKGLRSLAFAVLGAITAASPFACKEDVSFAAYRGTWSGEDDGIRYTLVLDENGRGTLERSYGGGNAVALVVEAFGTTSIVARADEPDSGLAKDEIVCLACEASADAIDCKRNGLRVTVPTRKPPRERLAGQTTDQIPAGGNCRFIRGAGVADAGVDAPAEPWAVEVVSDRGPAAPGRIAVSQQYVYYADDQEKGLARITLATRERTVLARQTETPVDIATSGDDVAWTTSSAVRVASGTSVATIATGKPFGPVRYGSKGLYFAAGGDVRFASDTSGTSTLVAATGSTVSGLAVSDGIVYWTTAGGGRLGLWRTTEAEAGDAGAGPTTPNVELSGSGPFEITAASSRLFFVANEELYTIDASLSATTQPASWIPGANERLVDERIATDGVDLFFANTAGHVKRVSASTARIPYTVAMETAAVRSVVVSGTHVYWVRSNGQIVRKAK